LRDARGSQVRSPRGWVWVVLGERRGARDVCGRCRHILEGMWLRGGGAVGAAAGDNTKKRSARECQVGRAPRLEHGKDVGQWRKQLRVAVHAHHEGGVGERVVVEDAAEEKTDHVHVPATLLTHMAAALPLIGHRTSGVPLRCRHQPLCAAGTSPSALPAPAVFALDMSTHSHTQAADDGRSCGLKCMCTEREAPAAVGASGDQVHGICGGVAHVSASVVRSRLLLVWRRGWRVPHVQLPFILASLTKQGPAPAQRPTLP